jgi:hypothetical protein
MPYRNSFPTPKEYITDAKKNLQLYKTESKRSALLFLLGAVIVFVLVHVFTSDFLNASEALRNRGTTVPIQYSASVAVTVATAYLHYRKAKARGGPVVNVALPLLLILTVYPVTNLVLFGKLITAFYLPLLFPILGVGSIYSLWQRIWAWRDPESMLEWEEKHMPELARESIRENYKLKERIEQK